MAGWLHGVFVGDWLFVFPLCGFSLSLFCNYYFSLLVHITSYQYGDHIHFALLLYYVGARLDCVT